VAVTENIDIQAMLDVAGVDPVKMERNEKRHLQVQHDGGGLIPIFAGQALTDEQDQILQPTPANTYEEFHSHELTLINGLRGAGMSRYTDDDTAPCIRANTGAGTIATPFGVKYEIFNDKMPWVTEHVTLDSLDDFDADTAPLGDVMELVMERSAYLAEKLAGSGITPFCFDSQGPFDAAHLVIGDEIFLAMYDEPDRVHNLLDQCTRMIIRTTHLYKQAAGNEPVDGGRHGGFAMRGGIRICEDTSTLVNRDQMAEFVTPYTRKLLQEFGGGWCHYCGRNDHLYDAIMDEIPEYYVVNFGNPDFHDMPAVLEDCLQRGKSYLGTIEREEGEQLKPYFERLLSYTQGTGRGLLPTPHIYPEEDFPDAVKLWRDLQG
jgi:hypothetical protein